jgi:hypothetical protein
MQGSGPRDDGRRETRGGAAHWSPMARWVPSDQNTDSRRTARRLAVPLFSGRVPMQFIGRPRGRGSSASC